MPPKKKRKVKGGKKRNSNEGDGQVEKDRRQVLDVAVLKEHLAQQRDVARQARSNSEDLKSQIRILEQALSQEKLDKRHINADLTRQYKTMHKEMEVKVNKLKTEVTMLSQQLVECQYQLSLERKRWQQREKDKDSTIAELQSKLENTETEYEKILHGSLDSLLSRMADTQLCWQRKGTTIHQKYKETLAEFGLNPLDI